MRFADCHTDRRHFARGFCSECYHKDLRARNPLRRTASSVDWAKRNPLRAYSNLLRSKFGITLGDYESMITSQGGGCKVCGRTREEVHPTRRLVVDHCHRTEKVRGVLCIKCNSALGMAEDSPQRLRKLAEYLESQQCQPQ